MTDIDQIKGLIHSTVTGDDDIENLPVLLGYLNLRNAPWIYDLGMDGYKQYWVSGDREKGCKTFGYLLELINVSRGTIDSNMTPDEKQLLEWLRGILVSRSKSR